MRGLKTTTVPVVMGALGTIKKDIENCTNKIPGNIIIHELQKITLLSPAHQPNDNDDVDGNDDDDGDDDDHNNNVSFLHACTINSTKASGTEKNPNWAETN